MLAILALGSQLFAVSFVAAQEETPEPGSSAVRYLPDAQEIGDEWSMLPAQGVSDLSTDVFREAAVGYYGGPDGARVAITVLVATNTRIAIRQSWEEANTRFDQYRYRIGSDYQRMRELERVPPPKGCEEVKRSEGVDTDFGFPTVLTLCAGANDEIILVVASGGDAGPLGFQLTDALAVLAIEKGGS
jgi:hypothetical protein